VSADSDLSKALKKQIEKLAQIHERCDESKRKLAKTAAEVERTLKESKKLTSQIPLPPKRS